MIGGDKCSKPPSVHPEPIDFSDEGSFRAARREWETNVLCDTALTTTDRLVGLRLASHAGPDTFPFPSAKTLAMDLGLSVRTVQGSIRRLTERGWLMKLRKLYFSGPMVRMLSKDPQIADGVQIRLEGNKVIRDIRRTMRLDP